MEHVSADSISEPRLRPRRKGLHPTAWILWAGSAGTAALLTRNPWYLLLIAAAALGVQAVRAGRPPGWGRLRLLGGLLFFPAVLNLILSRAGETVLLHLPIPWIGGPYTLEALLFGLSAGAQIACLLQVMAVFGDAVSAPDLLRRMPAGLYPVGVSASIGLTFGPRARRSFGALREAQQVRAYNPRGWRDLPILLTPMVVLSLESALGLAEGMVARGWGALRPHGWRRWLAPVGWLGLAVGVSVWALVPSGAGPALVCTLLGLGALALAQRGQNGRNRYRPEIWRGVDTLVVGLALGVALAFLLLSLCAPAWLTYLPYPRAVWPEFRLGLGSAVVMLTAPAWFRGSDH